MFISVLLIICSYNAVEMNVFKGPFSEQMSQVASTAGMHWQRHNVNPMFVLRNAVCNERWQETWRTARAQRQQHRRKLRSQRIEQRCRQACCRFVCFLQRLLAARREATLRKLPPAVP